jgi:peptide/nickel transport system permease protein
MTTQTSTANIGLKTEHKLGESLTTRALRRLRQDTLTLIAVAILITIAVVSYGAPVITQRILNVSHTVTDPQNNFLPIGTPGHILGTDDLGRDHLARLLYAGRVSLTIGFFAAVLSIGIGVSLGIMTGYYGGIIDDIMNWVIATLSSIPQLFLLLIISAVLAPKPETLIIVLGFLGWTGTMRLVRGETLSMREREFIIASRAIGASPWRVMFIHILPNLFSVIVITLAIDIGVLILVEAALSFLGLGVKPPTPTWGNMLTNAQSFFTSGWHLVVLPGVLIFVTVLCLYIIGDGLRDAFDPTARK